MTVMLSIFNKEYFFFKQILSIFNWRYFFKAVPDISHISQIGLKKLFTIIKRQFDGSKIASEENNLSYFI